MGTPKSPSVRLHVLIARSAPTAVIIRRGPSKCVRLIKWNLADDTFEPGQWIKGRIYPWRCDLSPSGRFLLYFSLNNKSPIRSWTAISKPPYFTALALWPKRDTWYGGGWFETDERVKLLHFDLTPHPDFAAGCRHFEVSLGSEPAHAGPPICDRFWKDGWREPVDQERAEKIAGTPLCRILNIPPIYRKDHPSKAFVLQRILSAHHEDQGPQYLFRYQILKKDELFFDLGTADWADWDKNGDLLFARDGLLFRQKIGAESFNEPAPLIDFRNDRFEPFPAPEWATRF